LGILKVSPFHKFRSSGWVRAKSADPHRLQRNDYADLNTLWDEVFEEETDLKDTLGNIE